mmetsp:Transcript_91449/g.289943  ORF Transcript_91449/g.289943 Transcript_91449/m.289943 type:complete len:659 (+) Transcript_91449:72-2048(+)
MPRPAGRQIAASVVAVRHTKRESSWGPGSPTAEFAKSKGPSVELVITRDDLVQQVGKRVDQDDAFITLPHMFVQLILLMLLVQQHLSISARTQLETALQDWIGEASKTLTGPFVGEHVANGATFWDWLEHTAVPAVYGGRDVGPVGLPVIEIAGVSVLLGDAQLRQRRADGSESWEWLLHSTEARADLNARPSDYTGAALNAVRRLRTAGWLNEDAEAVELRFATYNERAEMFGLTEVTVPFPESGIVKPMVVSTAAPITSYPKAWVYVVDVLYVLLISTKFYREAGQALTALSFGCGVFWDYWDIWNAIDWADIVLGAVGCVIWIRVCLAMQADALHALLAEDSTALHYDVMSLSVAQLTEVDQSIRDIRAVYIEMHLLFAANMVAIMAKFFKGFQANPRLKVVTATLAQSFQDIVHFMIVFITVFLCYALIGHVLFGSDLAEFDTTGAAINTGFIVLMGEFSWYADIQNYPRATLPSGVPMFFVNLWFLTYMFFVLLVLLNMLLAVVLSHYTDVTTENANRDTPTLWQQTKDWVKWKVETRNFFNLHKVSLLLESDDHVAHPGNEVTADSLLAAFPKMPQTQADFMIQWLSDIKMMEELDGTDDDRPEGVCRNNETKVQDIQALVKQLTRDLNASSSRLSILEGMGALKTEWQVNI